MTCEDCIHFEVCCYVDRGLPICDSFKDKSKFIELPCSVGDTVFITREEAEKKLEEIKKMTNEKILEWYNTSNPNDKIYGFMYGYPTINICRHGTTYQEPDKIISISKLDLKLSKNQDCFIFIWGWPGPDANLYKFKDYGVTWAFSEEILNAHLVIKKTVRKSEETNWW